MVVDDFFPMESKQCRLWSYRVLIDFTVRSLMNHYFVKFDTMEEAKANPTKVYPRISGDGCAITSPRMVSSITRMEFRRSLDPRSDAKCIKQRSRGNGEAKRSLYLLGSSSLA